MSYSLNIHENLNRLFESVLREAETLDGIFDPNLLVSKTLEKIDEEGKAVLKLDGDPYDEWEITRTKRGFKIVNTYLDRDEPGAVQMSKDLLSFFEWLVFGEGGEDQEDPPEVYIMN